jgi:cytochrome c-type biogenesis protein CcmH/NrfF
VEGMKRHRKRKVVKNMLEMWRTLLLWGGGMFVFLLSNEVLCCVKKRGMETLEEEEVWLDDEELKRV